MNKALGFIIVLFLIPFVSPALTSGEGTIVFGAISSLMIVAVFFLILSIVIASKPMKIFFISLSFLTILASVGMGVSVMQEFFSTITGLTEAYGQFYILLIGLTAGGFLALIVYLIIVSFKSFYEMRGITDQFE